MSLLAGVSVIFFFFVDVFAVVVCVWCCFPRILYDWSWCILTMIQCIVVCRERLSFVNGSGTVPVAATSAGAIKSHLELAAELGHRGVQI